MGAQENGRARPRRSRVRCAAHGGRLPSRLAWRGNPLTALELGSCAAAATLSAVGTWMFRAFAVRRGIVAQPIFRSLHDRPIPRGGGIVFGIVCITALAVMGRAAGVAPTLTLALVVGGLAATTFGFLDDKLQLPPLAKLLLQSTLAAVIVGAFGVVHDVSFTPRFVDLFASWIGLVWLMNAYNFIDGIDGLAASGAVAIAALATIALALSGTDGGFRFVFAAIAACSLGFLLFNWPPASIFMGDAGSLFLGFCVATLLTSSVNGGQIGIWTWAVILAFFIGDTTTTTVLRIFVTDRWYSGHRSHGYQNLARLHGHVRVLRGVLAYHLVWLLPLTIWSVLRPATAPLAALLAIGPVVLWTFRYGPRLSSS